MSMDVTPARHSPVPLAADAKPPASGEPSLLAAAGWTLAGLIALLLVLRTLPGATDASPSAAAPAPLPKSWQLSLRGLGPVRVGMSVAQAGVALGRPLRKTSAVPSSSNCTYFEIAEGPPGIYFMEIHGRIARIDVMNPQVETRSGARVGLSERQVLALYPGQIQIERHHYVEGGHYLVYTPKDRVERAFSMTFETDGSKVTSYRAGEKVAVGYVEFCL
jgi:hypothetical protein